MADLIDRDAVAYKVKSCITIPADNEWDSGYNTAMAEAKQYIENAPAVNRLIPCSEQMMPNGERVLVCLTNGEFFVMTRSGDVISDGLRYLTDLSGVERWMPLPESPEMNAQASTVEPPPIECGWLEDCSNGFMCSSCRADNIKDSKYCPNCGLKMSNGR